MKSVVKYLLFFFYITFSFGQFPFKKKESPIQWKHKIIPQKAKYKVGEEVLLVLEGTIQKGFHVFSAKPAKNGGYREAVLKLDKEAQGVKLVGKLLEEGTLLKEYNEIMEDTLLFYKNKVTFKQKIKITQKKARLVAFLVYQYCTDDEGQCFFPTEEIDIKLQAEGEPEKQNVAPTQTPEKPQNSDGEESPQIKEDTSRNTKTDENTATTFELPDYGKSANSGKKSSLWTTFIFAFLAGIFAIFTPCVFPMIPMTISFFLKQGKGKEEETGKGFAARLKSQGTKNALAYAFSILGIFTIIGLAMTVLFGKTILYEIASNPWMNLFFFIVLFLFGLSFLGWFEIRLPTSWATAIDKQSEKGGFLGIFFMALALVIVSFSCTGPLVGTVLIETAGGHYLEPFIGMLGFALAFALPFGILAFFPSLIQKWQQSRRGWLLTLERSLGFLELGFSFKFLSNSDLVWHLGILDREIFLAVWAVIALLWGLYLLGVFRFEGEMPVEGIGVPRMLTAAFAFGFIFYLLPGFFGAPLKMISGYLPPINEDIGVMLLRNQRISLGGNNSQPENSVCAMNRKYADILAKDTPPGFCAFYDLDEAIEYSKKVNKPLLLDFTGHTCNNCRQVENAVWVNPKVKEKINNDFILVSLFVDERIPLEKTVKTKEGRKLRTVGDKWLHLQDSLFGVQAQPYYVIVDENLRPLAEPHAFGLDVDKYLKFLEKGLTNYRRLKGQNKE